MTTDAATPTTRRLPMQVVRAAVRSSALRATGVLAMGTGVRFLTQLMLARWLGAAGYGVFVVARGWGESLAKLPTRGYLMTVVRHLPAYRAKENWPAFRGLLRVSAAETAFWGVLLTVSGLVVARIVGAPWGLQVGLLLVPVAAFVTLQGAVLQSLNRYPSAVLVSDLLQPLVLAAMVGLLVLLGSVGPSAAVAVYVASLVLAGVVLSLVRRSVIPPHARRVRPLLLRREWVRTARPLYIGQLALTVLGVADLLIVGAMEGPVAAGVFAAAGRLAFLSQILENGAESVAAGPISEAFSKDDRAAVQRQVDRTIALAAPPTIALMLLAFPFGGWVLQLLGPEFRSGTTVLLVLLASNVVTAVNGPVGFVISMSGMERTYARVMAGHAVLGAALAALAALVGGIALIAMATALTIVSWNIWLTVLAFTRLGIRCWPRLPRSPRPAATGQ